MVLQMASCKGLVSTLACSFVIIIAVQPNRLERTAPVRHITLSYTCACSILKKLLPASKETKELSDHPRLDKRDLLATSCFGVLHPLNLVLAFLSLSNGFHSCGLLLLMIITDHTDHPNLLYKACNHGYLQPRGRLVGLFFLAFLP